jgi:hypothetical protein
MALTRKLPSPISDIHPSEHHRDKRCIRDIILKVVNQGMEMQDCNEIDRPIGDTSLSSNNTKRRKLDHDEDDSNKNHCTACLTDPILDEAANEVAEESEWELILQQWNTEKESISFLIAA